MIKFRDSAANVVIASLTGIVTKDDVQTAYAKIDTALEGNKQIGVLVDFSEFDDATANAIAEDVKHEFALLSEIKRFAKVGIVTDKNWIASLMKMAGGFLPSIEMKVFAPSDLDKATDWIAEFEAAKGAKPAGIERIATNRDDLLAYEITGKMSDDGIERMSRELLGAYESQSKIDLLVRIKNFAWFEFDALFDDDLWKMKTGAFRHVNRYAIVGGPAWMQTVGKSFGKLAPVEIEFFTAEEEAEAWNWLDAKKAA